MQIEAKQSNKSINTKLRIFLSYSSAHDSIAKQVHSALTTSGHDVFFDRTNLPPGDEFDSAILAAIRNSDLFIFLISPDSVTEGRYTRTELRFARERWPNPVGHILPVLIEETDFSRIPNYLKAVTILEPEGNIPAEVSKSVNDLAQGISPEDTSIGQVEIIKKTIQELSELTRQQELERIDKQWINEQKKYLVKTNGKESEPSMSLVLKLGIKGLVGCISSIIAYRLFATFIDSAFTQDIICMVCLFGIISSGFLIWSAIRTYLKIQQFDEAKRNWLEQRWKAKSKR